MPNPNTLRLLPPRTVVDSDDPSFRQFINKPRVPAEHTRLFAFDQIQPVSRNLVRWNVHRDPPQSNLSKT
jgi:hypothetical protein